MVPGNKDKLLKIFLKPDELAFLQPTREKKPGAEYRTYINEFKDYVIEEVK